MAQPLTRVAAVATIQMVARRRIQNGQRGVAIGSGGRAGAPVEGRRVAVIVAEAGPAVVDRISVGWSAARGAAGPGAGQWRCVKEPHFFTLRA
jgi:hypothetical protein